MKYQKKETEVEWSAAQEIALSVDPIPAAKQMLQFLAAIDRNRDLYEGPALDRAIYRYRNCWLPLLAKQAEFDVVKGPLVVPLDCEWVWHCHRLNPTRYKADCEQRFGRILDNSNVVSTTKDTNCSKQTEAIWTRMFPDEPFELDLNSPSLKSDGVSKHDPETSIDYDLVSAVKRQTTFFYQVSRSFVSNDTFLKEAVARYKGFLHLIRKNKHKSINQFCVPTYDIDLIWHTHQLHPASYCKDTTAICGVVLEHDDNVDTDRSEGKELDVGFMVTTKQWEQVYGLRYWRAGVMFRGNAPSLPVKLDARLSKEVPDNVVSYEVGLVQLPKKMLIEVLLEIVDVKGVPQEQRDDLFVLFSNQGKDVHHITKKKLSISSENGKNQFASFQCQPTEELILELMSNSTSKKTGKSSKTIIGSTSISMKNIVNPERGLSVDAWFELSPSLEITNTNPISLQISLSFTPPFMAPYVVNLVHSKDVIGSHTSVLDEGCNPVIGLYMRQGESGEKEVIGVSGKGETRILAKNEGKGWSLMDSSWDLRSQNEPSIHGNVYELMGQRKVIIIPGMKLDYELECNKLDEEQDFITAIEFSPQHPYGKALALFHLKSGFLQIKEEWFLTPGIISAYILRDTLISNGAFRPTELMNKTNISENYFTKSGACSGGGGGGCGGGCGGGRCEGGSYRNGGSCKARCGGSCGNIRADCRARCGGTCKTLAPTGNLGADCRPRCGGTCKTPPPTGNLGADCRPRCGGTCKTPPPTGNLGADCRPRCGGTCKTPPPSGNLGADCRPRCGGTCKTPPP